MIVLGFFRLFILFTILIVVVKSRKLIKQVQFEDDIVELIQTSGYQSEVHKVETEDGYILKVHRILVKNEVLKPKSPVFMMHGLGSTASDYVSTGPQNALGYLLSDNGYDVWLGNSRGNKHSMQHKTLNVESKEFWNFSWHEIGIYDLPAMIEHMLTSTNHTKFYYVGFSQGTTASMVMLTTFPEYNDKIIQNHMLGPSAFFKHSDSIAKLMASKVLKDYFDMMGVYKSPDIGTAIRFGTIFCIEQTIVMCQNMLYFIFGWTTGEPEMGAKTITEGMLHISPFVALKQGFHYLQLVKSGRFRQFDYFENNSDYYNSSEPPDYDLAKITCPVYLYHGEQDGLLSLIDVEKLKSTLSNVHTFKIMKNWNHLDLLYGKNARRLLFIDILKSINSEVLK